MNTYKRHRFPPIIISYAVWLYYRFNPSHRDIEDLLAQGADKLTCQYPPVYQRHQDGQKQLHNQENCGEQ